MTRKKTAGKPVEPKTDPIYRWIITGGTDRSIVRATSTEIDAFVDDLRRSNISGISIYQAFEIDLATLQKHYIKD